LKVAILGQRNGWHTAALQSALARRGIDAPALPITQLTARVASRPWLCAQQEPLDAYKVLFVRTIPGGSLEQVIYRVDALHRLENAGVRVINSARTIERTVDKYYTSTLLEDAGLPTPRTVVTEQFEQAMAAFDELGGDVVVKPLFGSEGRGMTRVTDQDTAYRVLRALELGRYIYYLQEFIPHQCRDVRVFVVGTAVVGAMERRGASWKTNVAQGGRGIPIALDDTLCELALRATQVVGADYAGVDLLPVDDGGYTVIEVNGIPGWRGLKAATGVDAADYLAKYVLAGTT
jgi:RimK family alpha-L-glutamate ligase